MDAKRFFDTVVKMRKAQRAVDRAKMPQKEDIICAKDLERIVDTEIKRVELLLKERQNPRLDL